MCGASDNRAAQMSLTLALSRYRERKLKKTEGRNLTPDPLPLTRKGEPRMIFDIPPVERRGTDNGGFLSRCALLTGLVGISGCGGLWLGTGLVATGRGSWLDR